MAGFIQNYVGGIVQNAAVGAATYAITTGGRVVGDAVISAGDLIEGAGRGVGNSVEGYIDRYGNWIRSYGDGAIAATAADAPAYARTRTAVKPPKQKAPPGGAQKALPAPNKPGTKALPAPEPKKAAAAARPGLKKSLSDSASATAAAGAKGLPPVSGVKKVGGGAQLSKGQLAKARGIKAADLKGAGGKAVGAVADKKQGGGKGKDGKGGFDFMTLMAEDPKKKGPGSVAGSVKTNGTAKKAGAVGGGGKQETSGKYEFF
ncbi:hypothetical protein UCRNP2_5979 [Neofusicoccum parvum UCRNP2]|uniref:Uncharacterized protein n=1 Tax=Botryosphaeria parva (strain UCR-NP2) TaxID=1287680 RepID=R1G700_BOTPV|nr:hypothetical protein UCRNP2_5979 [Neofusicoccum parvum UCRNP2]